MRLGNGLLASSMMKLRAHFPSHAGNLGVVRRRPQERKCDHSRQRGARRLHWPTSSLATYESSKSSARKALQPNLFLSLFDLRTGTRKTSRATFTMAPLYSSGDPVLRTSSPYPDPRIPGPRSQILALNNNNYHSSSLSTLKMVTVNTVNKTALHPGGVQYVLPSLHLSSVLWSIVTDSLQACQGAHRTRRRTAREGTHRL
jgi:hypothetical protein